MACMIVTLFSMNTISIFAVENSKPPIKIPETAEIPQTPNMDDINASGSVVAQVQAEAAKKSYEQKAKEYEALVKEHENTLMEVQNQNKIQEQVEKQAQELQEVKIPDNVLPAEAELNEIPLKNEPFKYSDEDLYLLAGIIMSEAGHTDNIQRAYVGSVVINRVFDPRFPNTIQGVLTQSGQYTTVKNGHFKLEPDAESYFVAKELLDKGSVLPSPVVWQSNGKQGKTVYVKYNNMYYCI